MKITVKDGKAYVETPYNTDFISVLKQNIGGARWSGKTSCWVIPEDAIELCRRMMEEEELASM